MLRWALVFLVFSFVAAIFGFSGISATASDIARMIFYVFIGLFLLSFIFGLAGRGDRLLRKKL